MKMLVILLNAGFVKNGLINKIKVKGYCYFTREYRDFVRNEYNINLTIHILHFKNVEDLVSK